jgi:hypothetical protein
VWFVRQDEAPPETTITKAPKPKTRKRRARFAFASSEPFSTFECNSTSAASNPVPRLAPTARNCCARASTHSASALDEPGNTDPTPAKMKWNVRR